MQLSKAISYRLSQLLAEKQLSSYQLSGKSAVPTSTISNIILCHGKSCTVATIYDLCRGATSKSAIFSVLLSLISKISTTTVDSF